MAFDRVELSDDQVASFLRVTRATVRRRRAAGELRAVRRVGEGGGELVQLSPLDDWLRTEDAGALLGVSPTTVRAAIERGQLIGRRDEGGRWRVQLQSVLEDRRCDPAAVALFSGEEPERRPLERRPRRPSSMRRPLLVHLDEDDVELLERGRDRHGTYRRAVVEGLRAIDGDGQLPPDALAELRAELEVRDEQLQRARGNHDALRRRAARHHVDDVYCPQCEQLVPIDEIDQEQLEDGTVELYHQPHGYRRHSRVRGSTVLARRRGAS